MFSVGMSLLSLDPLTSDTNSTVVPDKAKDFLFHLSTFGSRWPPTSLIFIHTPPPSSHSFHPITDSLLGVYNCFSTINLAFSLTYEHRSEVQIAFYRKPNIFILSHHKIEVQITILP